jgi:hypothetical protein
MSEDLAKWFSDPKHGEGMQDMDLVLADVGLLPRLKTYLDEPSAPEWKKQEVISALLELLEHDCPRDGGLEAARLADDIRTTIRQHADIAERAMPNLGLPNEALLRCMLGLPIPSGYPQWMIDLARERGV